MPTKLLVPKDGSGSAIRALKLAAKAHGAVVLVLDVQPAYSSSRFVSKAMVAEHQRRSADDALAPARALLKRLKSEARTAIGEPAATIAAFAQKHRCSGIVMGSRGQGRIAGLMLGSVAAKVIYLAKCPVTVVK